MKNKQIIFIASSGRSGTLSISNLLSQKKNIEVYHEFLFDVILYNAVRYKMKLISKSQILNILKNTYGLSIHYSDKNCWVDCSNALPWIIKPLFEIFPNSKVVHLVRDGRKVTSSFYNKFGEIMYSNYSTKVMINWLKNKNKIKQPPPHKKFWRPVPINNKNKLDQFKSYNHFERICYYWNEINIEIKNNINLIPYDQKLVIRFEDLINSDYHRKKFNDFCNFNLNKNDFKVFDKPINIHIKKNYLLTNDQLKKFKKICWNTMKEYNYHQSNEYNVKY